MARTPQEIEQEKNKRKNEQMQKLLRAEQQKKSSKPKVSQQKQTEQKQPRRDTIPVLRQNTSVLQPSDLTGWNTARAVTPAQTAQLPQLPTVKSWINGLDRKNEQALSRRGIADNSPDKSAEMMQYLAHVPELKSAYQNASNRVQTIPVLQPMDSYARDAEISRGELNKLFKQSEQADAKIAELGKIPNGKRQGYAKQEIAKAKNERSDIHDKANIASYSNKRANTMLNIQKTPGLEDALSAFRNSVRQTGDIDTSIPEGVELANARVAARNEILQKYNMDLDRFNEIFADYDEAKTIEENQATEQKAMEFGQEHPVAATGVGLALSPVTALSGLGSQVEGWQNPRPMSEYSDIFLPNILQSGMRSGAAENIDSELGQFAYGAGNSIADVVLNGLIAKGAGSAAVGGALTGARVSGDSMQDALSRGASNKQAAATGLASGAAEGIGETLSLGSILKPTTATGFKNVAKNLGKSALVEGSEEGVTNIVNTAFDSMINGQNSAFNTNVANYRAQGMSEDAAVKQASSDYFKQLLTDMAAGGIAGGALGGINMAMSGSKLRNKVPVLESVQHQTKGNTANAVTKANIQLSKNAANEEFELKTYSNSNGIDNYTNQEISNLSSEKGMVNGVDDYRTFIQNSVSNSDSSNAGSKKKRYYFGKVSEELATDIKKNTGYDVIGRNIAVREDELRHALNEHPEVTIEDLEILPSVFNAPDSIIKTSKTDYAGRNAIEFTKRIDGVIATVTGVADGRNSLEIDTVYFKKINPNRTANGASTPNQTPETGTAQGLFDNSIPNSAQNVNTTMSERVNPANTYIEVLPHANDYANNVMDTVDGYVKLYGDDNSKAMAAEARGKIDTFFENPTEQNMQEWFDAILKVNSSLQGKKNFNKRFKSTQVYRDEIMDTFSEDGSRIFGRTIEDIDSVGDYSASTTMNESVDSNNAEMTIPVLKQTKSAKENAMQIPPGMRERGYAESIRTKTDLPDEIKQEFVDSPEIYQQLSNASTKEKADNIMQNSDLQGAINQYRRMLDTKDAAAIPLGYDISKQLIADGRREEAVEVLRDMSAKLTEAGQFTQASAITMMQNDPQTALRYLEREIDNINKKGREKYGDKWDKMDLTDDEIDAVNQIEPGDKEAIEDLYNKVSARIAQQYPSTKWEKFVELRKLSFLLNPRTHIRNTASNTIASPLRSVKDRVAAVGELGYKALIDHDFNRTQSLIGGNLQQKRIAKEIFDTKWKSLLDDTNSKWEDVGSNAVKNKRVFKTGWLEKLRQFDYKLLGEIEDNPFVRSNFVNRLGSYMHASNITDINNVPEDAQIIAYQEALKATFKDDNFITQALTGTKKSLGKGGDILLPFTKTPANLTMRSIEYSPAGIIKAVTEGAKGGKPQQVIDSIASSLTGTGVIALGMLLAKNGIITGSLDEDKDKKAFEQQQGKQAYSIKIGDNYYSYDWALPSAAMLIMGADIMNAINQDDTENYSFLNSAKNAVGAGFNSIADQSSITNLSELFAEDPATGKINWAANIADTVLDIPSELIPTLMGAVTRTMDQNYHVAYDPNSAVKTKLNEAKAKIPFLSQTLPVSHDTWGNERKRSDSVGEAAFAQLINPGQLSNSNIQPMDSELIRLNEATGDNRVFPAKAAWNVDGKHLTNQEYSEYQKALGTRSSELVSALQGSDFYKELPDDMRVETLNDMYLFANALTKSEQFGYDISESNTYKKMYEVYSESGVDGLIDYCADKEAASNLGMQYDTYKKKQSEYAGGAEQYATDKQTAIDMGFVDKEGNANLDAYQKAQNAFGGDSRYIQQYANLDSKAQAQYGKSFSGAKLEQKIPMLEGMNISNAEKGKYLAAASGDMGKKATAVYNQYGPEGYYLYYLGKSNKDDMDYNGNGKVTKDERESYFRQMGLANEMAAFLAKQGF